MWYTNHIMPTQEFQTAFKFPLLWTIIGPWLRTKFLGLKQRIFVYPVCFLTHTHTYFSSLQVLHIMFYSPQFLIFKYKYCSHQFHHIKSGLTEKFQMSLHNCKCMYFAFPKFLQSPRHFDNYFS